MTTCCETITSSELSKFESQANSISNILEGLSAAPVVVSLNLHSIALYSQLKLYLKGTDISCFDIRSRECSECLKKIKAMDERLLNNYNRIYEKIKRVKPLFISKYLFGKAIKALEDRIETLEISTDPELTEGLTKLVSQLEAGSQTNIRDWQEVLNGL